MRNDFGLKCSGMASIAEMAWWMASRSPSRRSAEGGDAGANDLLVLRWLRLAAVVVGARSSKPATSGAADFLAVHAAKNADIWGQSPMCRQIKISSGS